jgi:hypothetical protein
VDRRSELANLQRRQGGARRAARNAPSKFPLILPSHGHIAAAVDHPSNNGAVHRGGFHALVGTHLGLEYGIDGMLADSAFGGHLDPERIGTAGFSLGGYTMIEIAGGITRRIERFYRGHGGPLALRGVAYAAEGDVGYIIGAYSGRAGAPDDGKFTLILRKDASGRWLIVSDMDNGNRRQ